MVTLTRGALGSWVCCTAADNWIGDVSLKALDVLLERNKAAAKEATAKAVVEKAAAAKKAADEKAEAEAAPHTRLAAIRANADRRLALATSCPLSTIDASQLVHAIEMARESGVAAEVIEAAAHTLHTRSSLDLELLALLEELGGVDGRFLVPRAPVTPTLTSLAAVAAVSNTAALEAALGAESAARLQAAAQQSAALTCLGSFGVDASQLTSQLTESNRIGGGADADVYAVELHGRLLAFKKIRLSGLSQAERIELLRSAHRDFRALRRLSHANIVALHGAVNDVATSTLGLLIERAERGSLRDLLNNTPHEVVGVERVQHSLATGIASGMAYLHAKGPVLHHDLKSANVLVFAAGGELTPKLCDFGLAAVANATTAAASTRRAAAGTAAYKAPEQFDDRMSMASEVYSFAIVLWELLQGDRPWAGKSELVIMRAVDRGERPPVTATDSLLRQLMEQCWAPEPAHRPSFADVSTRLAAAARTFATSQYKAAYDQLQARAAPVEPHELLTSVYEVVAEHARRHSLSAADAHHFFQTLQANALQAAAHSQSGANAVAELLTQPQIIALRMYSSAAALPNGREFCSVLNEAIREDTMMGVNASVAYSLCSYLHTRMSRGGGGDGVAAAAAAAASPVQWPPANRVFRGGALPPQHHWFFSVGRQYRIPMFLSTSGQQHVADRMMADRGGPHFCRWMIEFDASRRCDHVNFVNKNDGTLQVSPNAAAEDEYLFAPYATFTVVSAMLQLTPTVANPHVVQLRAAVNNRNEPDDLPSAPWA